MTDRIDILTNEGTDPNTPRCEKQYTQAWESHAHQNGQGPWPPDPTLLRNWIAKRDNIGPDLRRKMLFAVRVRHLGHRDPEPDPEPWRWHPTKEYLVAISNRDATASNPRAHAPTRPLRRDDLDALALADTPKPGRQALVHRNTAALHLLRDGHTLSQIARIPADTTAPGTPADTAHALARLREHLPPDATLALGLTTHGNPETPDPRPPKILNSSTALRASIKGSLASAARRANLPWNPNSSPDQTDQLTTGELARLTDHLDPRHAKRLRDHAERLLRHELGSRAREAHRARRRDATRGHDQEGPYWKITLTIIKRRSIPETYTATLRPHPNPLRCPVAALDAHTAELDNQGHTNGPLLPSDHGQTQHLGNTNRRIKRAAERAKLDTHGISNRSHRTGPATELVENGAPLDTARKLLRQKQLRTTALYVTEATKRYVLDL